LLKQLIRRFDLRAIGQADAVILCDEARKEQISGSRPRQIIYVYNSPEEAGTQPGITQPIPPASFHLAYVGLIQVERGLLDVLEALRRHADWRLDLAGFGGDQERILELACQSPNVAWHGRVPYSRAIQLSRAADALFALYDPTIPNHRYASPNKVFEALMLGKPIVVAGGTNMDHIVNEAGCGLIVPYGDVDALDAAFSRLAADPNLRRQLGSNGRQAYQARYSWAIMEQRLTSLYQSLFSQ
jgi:glycosyltransferase involved in cell wall biosynthesis